MFINKITMISPYEKRIPLQVASYRAYLPCYGFLSIATTLRNVGYEVKAYCEASGSKVDWRRVAESDVICFSLMSFSSRRGYEFVARIRRMNPEIPIIVGGAHASVLPEECLDHFDYVVRNEGEAIIVELLEAIENGGDVSEVKGISYIGTDGTPVHNPPADFIKSLDIVADPGLIEGYSPRTLTSYFGDTLKNGVLRFNFAVAQTSRGCPFECRFCFVKQELGRRYRTKSPALVLREIELALDRLKTRYVFFADNDVAVNRKHALKLFSLIEQRFHGDIDMFFFTRAATALDQELMGLIERAGRACIGVGIESIAPETLEDFNKKQTIHDIEYCLEEFSRYNVKIQPLFIFGSDNVEEKTLRRSLAFVLKHKVYNWGFSSLFDFPTRGKVLGYPQVLPDDRFIHRDWRFYTGNFVVHYPAKMRPSVLQREMETVLRKFYSLNRNTFYQYYPIRATYRNYISFLEKAEAGLYNNDGTLREHLLPGPMYDTFDIGVSVNRLALLVEIARFYAGNILRPQSWKQLASLVTNSSYKVRTNPTYNGNTQNHNYMPL